MVYVYTEKKIEIHIALFVKQHTNSTLKHKSKRSNVYALCSNNQKHVC